MKDQEEFSLEDVCRILAWGFKGSKTKTEITAELSEVGFSIAKIAHILDIPSNAASSLLNQSKKSKKK